MLFEFVRANLNVDDIKTIEKMIDPPTVPQNSESMSDKRVFLYEVCHALLIIVDQG